MDLFSTVHIRAGILVVIVTAAALLSTIPSLEWPALAVVVVAAGLLGWLLVQEGRGAAKEHRGSDELRRRTVDLEEQVQTGVADARDDLSDRVALEHRLRASEARWRAVIDSAVDGIVVIDDHARIEAFNPAAERLFGYTEEELLGQNVHVLMPSPYHEEHDTYLARYLATGQAKIIGTGREVTGRRRDGTTFPLHLSVGELMVEGERRFTGILHDLTARVQLEDRLREGATLAKIGEMAAVIAHEVKNPLAGIRGAIQVIGGRLPADSRDVAVINGIIKRIDALDGLMKDLLVFARPPQVRLMPVDVALLVTMSADLLCQDPLLNGIEVDVVGSAPPLRVDAEMVKMVFQNLLLNSAHAMQGQGKIDVMIAAIDGACEIAFSDSGPGIPAKIRDKIFTPFYTTKARGSGLGLATAKRLVEAHHGVITVECPPTGGTKVTIRLPSADSSQVM